MAERLWYAALNGKQAGPFNDGQLRDLIGRGQVKADTLVWSSPMTAWSKAGDIPGLLSAAARLPAGPPAYPPARAPAPRAAAGTGAAPLTLTAGVWPLLGRSLLVAIGQILVIPSPWTNTSYYRWIVEHIELPIAKQAMFIGKPMDIWYIFMLSALCGYAGTIHSLLPLLAIPLNVFFYIIIIRWFLTNLTWEGRTAPLEFTGGYLPLLGWFLLLMVSAITIVGWAWVVTAMNRWLCRHVEGSSEELSFIASGWGVLWRTWLFAFSCIFLIPIPWTLHWYMGWTISQFCLSERAQTA